MAILDARSFLLVLYSMTDRRLLAGNPKQAFPLAGLQADDFGRTTWKELGVSDEDRALLQRELAGMFPSGQNRPFPEPFSTPADMAESVFQDWEKGEQTFVYRSSGTTGAPKPLPHPLEDMEQELEDLVPFFPGVRRILSLTPQYHCFGFTFNVVLHKRLGAALEILPPLPTVVRHALGQSREPTLVVGFPDFWARMPAPGFSPPAGMICLSAGSPWPDDSMARLNSLGCATGEIYGSSENGTIGFRSLPGDFDLLSYWTKQEDRNGTVRLSRVLPSGRPVVHELQDMLRWSSPRTFRPVRRLDFAVQVSGVNVYPMRIARFMEEHPMVSQCRVRLMRPEEGRRLKAFIVPGPGADPARLKRELKTMLKDALTPPERPVSFTIGSALPKTNFGKDKDW